LRRALPAASIALGLLACGSGSSTPSVAAVVRSGVETRAVAPRGEFSGLKVRFTGQRQCALEVAIDAVEASTRRFICRVDGADAWSLTAAADEVFSDFAVHPSGEITLALEQTSRQRDGYELVRLGTSGGVLARDLIAAAGIPASDRPDLPDPPFLFRSTPVHALTDGWLRVEAHGEDLVAAWNSSVEGTTGGSGNDLAAGVTALAWTSNGYQARWSHIVEGRHFTQPAAWTYDEFRWREAAVRPLLAVAEDGTVIVGRSWNQSRCRAVNGTFGEFTLAQCRDFPSSAESEYLPFAFTSFSPDGTRQGTRVFVPDLAAEFIVFDLAVRRDSLALAGSVVFGDANGNVVRYPPDNPVMVPYDGYLAVLDRASGALRCQRAVDYRRAVDARGTLEAFGRAEHFAAVRWASDDTLLAAGGAGWDRWYGGMSISRGADPWIVALSPACDVLASRATPFPAPERHNYLLGVDTASARIAAVGFSDAPMTHSGDNGQIEQRMFGALRLELH
jgi:hypothetical protein